MKLKYKLSALIFILILAISATNYLLLTKTFKDLQVKRLESAEAFLGKSLAHQLYRMVIESRKERAVATLFQEKNLRENKLQYLVVNDRQGNLFVHTFLSDVPKQIHDLRNDFTPDQNYRIDDLLKTKLNVYNVGVPIREGIIQVGTLHIGIGEKFITDAVSPLKRVSVQTFLLAVVVILVGAILAYLLSFAVTSSLSKLEEWSVKLSNGDYEANIDIKTRDEVGRLAGAFMQMRDKIQDAHKRLERHNQNLEALVQERTGEIEKNYQQLKELNNELDEQRKNLKIVFSAMNYPLYVVNKDYTISMMNDETKKMITKNMQESYKCHTISHRSEKPCSTDDHPCPLQTVFETKKPVTLEHIHYDQHGNQMAVEVRAYPIFDEEGNVVQMVESCIDITDKKKAEEEKLRLERELSQANKLQSIGTLAAGIAHEINTPIQFIGDNTLFAEDAAADLFDVITQYKVLLAEIKNGEKLDISKRVKQIDDDSDIEYLMEELPKALTQTRDGIDHVGDIVRAMKDFAHQGSKNGMQAEDINHAIDTTVTIARNEWKYVSEIDTQFDDSLPLVQCNIGEIKQVLLNLIVNAAHTIGEKKGKTGTKGKIHIETRSLGDKVEVSIGDNGMGIEPEHQKHIFDPFFTTKDVGKGTGQGLSVAYQIVVEKHGGNLWFETEKGMGSTFHMTLPAK